MSSGDRPLSQLVGDLTNAVEQLQSELEANAGPPRPPTPRQLARFTSDVTIPAIILVLETNVRALRLVQRALRIPEGRDVDAEASGARQRATELGRATLTRLDDALTDLGETLDDSSTDGDARDLLQEVRDLQSEVDQRLEQTDPDSGTDTERGASDSVDIDVDAELQSIKHDVEGDNSHEGEKGND
jgi:hypothetical protein